MGKPKQANVEKWWGSKEKGGDLKIMFYNITLVFSDLFGSLDQEKEGVRHDPQLFVLKD